MFRLQRVVHHPSTGRLTYQVEFGITSLTAEEYPMRRTKRQRVLACLNNLVIGLIRQFSTFDYIPEARRFFSLHYEQALQLLL